MPMKPRCCNSCRMWPDAGRPERVGKTSRDPMTGPDRIPWRGMNPDAKRNENPNNHMDVGPGATLYRTVQARRLPWQQGLPPTRRSASVPTWPHSGPIAKPTLPVSVCKWISKTQLGRWTPEALLHSCRLSWQLGRWDPPRGRRVHGDTRDYPTTHGSSSPAALSGG